MIDLEHERVLVTGGHGFLGSHVSKIILDRGCEEFIRPKRSEHDLTRREEVEELFISFRPTVVIHLAALVGGIGANQDQPGFFWHENMVMGVHILDACRAHAVKRLIVTGTICAYPKIIPVPFREEDLWAGFPEETNAPYGIAKKSLLTGFQAYRKQYGLRGAFLLPTNLFGPGDSFDPQTSHVIPALILKFSEAKKSSAHEVICWGSGAATREFLYVEDCAEAVVLAAERISEPDPINLGSGQEISIKNLAEMISKKIGYMGKILWDTSKPDGQPRRWLNTARAEKTLRWKSKTGFEEGLDRTILWYLSHPLL